MKPIENLPPGGALGVCIATALAAVNCAEQWRYAYLKCAQLSHKEKKLRGGHKNTHDCAKGFVSQACGGNLKDYGKKKKKKKYKF